MIVPHIKRLSAPPNQIRYGVKNTLFGEMMVGECSDGICWMGFDFDGSMMRERFPASAFIEGKEVGTENAIALYGTDFQILVWKTLLDIPRGQTKTYGAVANEIGKPKAYRAVGSAVGANPISGIIPCHRVLPASGGVGNYLWGAEKKEAILTIEKP